MKAKIQIDIWLLFVVVAVVVVVVLHTPKRKGRKKGVIVNSSSCRSRESENIIRVKAAEKTRVLLL